jgi:multicomponent Na+:H+ antiporter subunit G
MTWQELGILLLAAIGVFFMSVSSIGVLRLPDVYLRMQAAGKATTLGIGCILLAAGFVFGEWALLRMVILLVLFFITGPIASAAITHAAYRTDYERELVLHYDELAAFEEEQGEAQAAQNPSQSVSPHTAQSS